MHAFASGYGSGLEGMGATAVSAPVIEPHFIIYANEKLVDYVGIT